MPTTSNFGWTTPADTDLVKDGAAAIRTLGNGIDTSFLDLKGGTTGQVLSKASNTDLDFSWVAQDDSNAIQNAIVDAKGDLISATAADTPARLAVGTNGQVLTADSTTSTGLKWAVDPVADVITTAGDLIYGTAADTVARLGIGTAGQVLKVNSGATAPEWGAASAASYSGVSLGNTADQTISNTTNTAITWSTEGFDTDSFHSTVTNTSRITIPAGKAGKYQVNLFGSWYNNSTGVRILSIYLNGAVVKVVKMQSVLEEQSQMIAMTLNLSVGDYVEGYVYQNSGGSRIFYTSGDQGHMSMSYLGA